MATTEKEDQVEYESDPDEAKGSLVMRRRRAASDDEEERMGADGGKDGDDGGGGVEEKGKGVGGVQQEESDGEGAVAEYDDDEEGEEEEYYLDGEEDDYVDGEGGYDEEGVEVAVAVSGAVADDGVVVNKRVGGPEPAEETVRKETDVASSLVDNATEWGDYQGEEEEEEEDGGNLEGKKENEPFAVPTAGAFYMHDDRFRDNVGGEKQVSLFWVYTITIFTLYRAQILEAVLSRTFGAKKLWESKDDRKWGHDKYEEMTVQERRFDERRRGRGSYRGRGRNRVVDQGYPRGYRTKSYENGRTVTSTNDSSQNQVARSVRGRGPRRYETSLRKSNQEPSNKSKQYTKNAEAYLQDNTGRSVVSSMNRETDGASARKQTFASSLSSASLPFYPSSSSSKDASSAQRKETQSSNNNRINRPSGVDDKFSVRGPNALVQGQNASNSTGMEKLSIDDSFSASVGKPVKPMSVTPVNDSHSLHNQNRTQTQGRVAGFPVGTMTYQPISQGRVGRASPAMQVNSDQKSPTSSRVHPTNQQQGHRPGSGQSSSPSKVSVSDNSYEILDTDSPTESSKHAGALVPKGKATVQGSGKGSFLYGGPQVVGAGGNTGMGHGDQNFPGTPAFLPVMQFGGQHSGGLGVPAVGMAFPGYVAQPQLGMGNSEMTWLPVLAGAAGALGAAYCSPYIAVDGAYHASSGQATSASSSSKESHSNKPNNEGKPAQRSEVVNEDYGQRQNKPRRYSEMNFGQ
ncbi:hypothetical protein MLD38_007954 [Melastoma candidum]|uniref:Uncharacterized protein n=1 Tax=Melastoma candidum TaxID=119954 RepID=A0ACB9RU40_9MYRT|nr:hypothetical protein MLD38_007954 [Melastoma candidum]